MRFRRRTSFHLPGLLAALAWALGPSGAPPARAQVTQPQPQPAQVLFTLGDSSNHWDAVRAVAYSPDGKLFASASDDGTIRVRDAARKNRFTFVAAPNRQLSVAFYSLAFSPDGKRLAAACADKTVKQWDLATGKPLRTLAGHRDAVFAVAYSPDGKELASAGDDRTVRVWDPVNPEEEAEGGRVILPGVRDKLVRPLRVFDEHGDFLSALAWSPDGQSLAVGLWDARVQLWDAATGKVLRNFGGHTRRVTALAFSRDGRRLVTAGLDGQLFLWNAGGGLLRRLPRQAGAVLSAAFAPDGTTLATGGLDRRVHLWGASGKLLRALPEQRGSVTALAFSPDGQTLASGNVVSEVRFWKLDGTSPVDDAASQPITALAVAPGGVLATGDAAGTVRLWEAASGKQKQSWKGTPGEARAAAFSRDGKLLASAGRSGVITLRDASTGKTLSRLQGHRDAVRTLSFSPDGKRLASGSADRTVRLWQVPSGKGTRTFARHQGEVTSLAFLSGGDEVLSAADDRTILLWGAETAEVRRTFEPDEDDDVLAVAVRPDGKQLASTGNQDRSSKLWDLATAQPQRLLLGHFDRSLSVAYASDGKSLATAAQDGTVRIWDSATGKTLRTLVLRSPRGAVRQVQFLPDGERLVTLNGNGTVSVVRLNGTASRPDRSARR